MSEAIMGTCSLCGGRVSVPSTWMCTIPPRPKCQSCGAHPAASWGPVIPMERGSGSYPFGAATTARPDIEALIKSYQEGRS